LEFQQDLQRQKTKSPCSIAPRYLMMISLANPTEHWLVTDRQTDRPRATAYTMHGKTQNYYNINSNNKITLALEAKEQLEHLPC